jgi:anti-sigma regulatory factor (Ser/Thr protein kinase)
MNSAHEGEDGLVARAVSGSLDIGPAAEPNRLTVRLPPDPRQLSGLRKRLDGFLRARHVGEADRFDLIVAGSEAAANAMEYPVAPKQPVITVEVTITADVAEVTVRDTGRWRPAPEAGPRGRGADARGRGHRRVSGRRGRR